MVTRYRVSGMEVPDNNLIVISEEVIVLNAFYHPTTNKLTLAVLIPLETKGPLEDEEAAKVEAEKVEAAEEEKKKQEARKEEVGD